jgi:hypothetical protein
MTEIQMYDGLDLCSVLTDQPRILRKLRKLRALYPKEIMFIERKDGKERWRVPFWWWNCRKRNNPQMQNINGSQTVEA